MAISILGIINFLSPKDLSSARTGHDIAYGSQTRQKLDIYAPRGTQEQDAALPVVMFIYGGSWSDGSRKDYEFVGRALAAQGFVTVIADYRLLPEVEYPVFLHDCAAALAWVTDNIARHGGDPDRIALMGHSAGAYNAVMLALNRALIDQDRVRQRIRCVVGLSGPYDFLPFDGAITLRVFGAVRDRLATQPIHFASAAACPMFLATGDRDTLVYPRNTVALARRLAAEGVEIEERHYPKLGHPGPLLALGWPGRLFAPVLSDAATFLHRHLDAPVLAAERPAA